MSSIDKVKIGTTIYDIKDANAAKTVSLTKAEYQALSEAEKKNGTVYHVTDEYSEEMSIINTATVDSLGIVKPDGTTITVDEDGTIHGSSTYTLPKASTTTLGGVKVDGSTVTIAEDGTISSSASGTGMEEKTQAQYDALPEDEKNSGVFIITDSTASPNIPAKGVKVNVTDTIFNSDNVQGVTEEVSELIGDATKLPDTSKSVCENVGVISENLTKCPRYNSETDSLQVYFEGSWSDVLNVGLNYQGSNLITDAVWGVAKSEPGGGSGVGTISQTATQLSLYSPSKVLTTFYNFKKYKLNYDFELQIVGSWTYDASNAYISCDDMRNWLLLGYANATYDLSAYKGKEVYIGIACQGGGSIANYSTITKCEIVKK